MSKVQQLSTDDFARTISDGVTLVDFWAPWCGPCKMQLPILETVAEKIGTKATVAKLNVDDSPEPAAQYGVRGIPTLIVFRDGEQIEQLVGIQQETTLLNAIEKAVS